ncbi:hypothetical protein Snoj_34460 [Streptomyces nojiriensis]|uniref:Uncharacterized protein n=1 Tax=Streptomyces nojiriensis TaxID=66374 RepID=A0ABQ3SN19_9ACTN|nr:hypothetical protein GCM10010205_71370 [Streptomyces nojiriensis]GHI69528.1 hypothetical protein Snoj_34460 [Streptomyces nojiriensis]
MPRVARRRAGLRRLGGALDGHAGDGGGPGNGRVLLGGRCLPAPASAPVPEGTNQKDDQDHSGEDEEE